MKKTEFFFVCLFAKELIKLNLREELLPKWAILRETERFMESRAPRGPFN